MKYIIYAEQDKAGRWHGFLQKSWEKGEHGHEGSVRWLDPTKEPDGFATEEDALAAARKLAEEGGIKEVFVDPADTDYKEGVVSLASKDAVGTEEQKAEESRTAETTEKARVEAAIADKAGG